MPTATDSLSLFRPHLWSGPTTSVVASPSGATTTTSSASPGKSASTRSSASLSSNSHASSRPPFDSGYAAITSASDTDSADEHSIFLENECLVCHATDGPRMRCVNHATSCHRLAPCRGIWCVGCYAAEDWIFHSIRDDGLALCMRPVDSQRPGWRCHLCELACMLGRPLHPDDGDWEVCQLGIQYKIDAAHHLAPNTANGYHAAWRLLQKDICLWQGGPIAYVEDRPCPPPAHPQRQYALEVGLSILKSTSALNGTNGRGPEGQCTFGHARARRSAFAHVMSRHPAAHDAVQKNPEFLDFIKGLPKRVGTMSTPSFPLHIDTILAIISLSGSIIRAALARADHDSALREMGGRLALVYAFFLITRGNEPFRLRRHHWEEGLFLGAKAAAHGMPEHIRPSFRFPTKTMQTSYKDGVLAPVTASGVHIGAMTTQYQHALLTYGHLLPGDWHASEGRLFPNAVGTQWTCGAFCHDYLRPRLFTLQRQGHPHLLDIDISSRIDFWSVRRGANTWADTDNEDVPRLPEADKEEHCYWADLTRKRSRTSRHYSQKPLAERLKVTSRHM